MKSAVFIFLGLAVAALPILSQAPAGTRPQFETATIKVHPPPITRISAARVDQGTGGSRCDRQRAKAVGELVTNWQGNRL